MSNSSAR